MEDLLDSASKPIVEQENNTAHSSCVDPFHEDGKSERGSGAELDGELDDDSDSEDVSWGEIQKRIAANTIYIKNEPEMDDSETERMHDESSGGLNSITIKREPPVTSESEEAAHGEVKVEVHLEEEAINDRSCEEMWPSIQEKTTILATALAGARKLYPSTSCPRTYLYPPSLQENGKEGHTTSPPCENMNRHSYQKSQPPNIYNNITLDMGGCEFVSNLCSENYQQKIDFERLISYKCDICGKVCNKKPQIREHILKHIGEKPHICELCGTSYRRKSSLKLHMLSHGAEKAHSCKICGKSFFQKGNLTTHMLNHTSGCNYRCWECGKTFSQKRYLHDHCIRHTNDKPYSCNVCSKAFVRKYLLTEHIRLHTGETPHACSVCGKQFRHKRSLAQHIKIHRSVVME